MALGGIPVSGGIAGNGTLIGTNLLRSPLILLSGAWKNVAYTLGGTAGETGYGVDWIKDGDQKTKLKTAPSSSAMTVTMVSSESGAPYPTVYGVVLAGHNLTSTNVTLAKFEGGTDTDYDDVSVDLVINAATLSPAYHLLASPQAYRYWRLRIQFTSELALQIGEVFLIGSPPLPFDPNFEWRGKVDEDLGTIVSDGGAGIRRRKTIWARYWREFRFGALPQAQYDAIAEIARNGYCVFSPEGANGYAYLGDIEKDPAGDEFVDQLSLTMRFTEAAK